jgi:hypothetical protein
LDVVKVGWSGGKDSTCAVSLHIRQDDYVKAVCYVPMFTKEIPLITKRHHNFILETAEFFRRSGAEVYFAEGMTYWDYVTHRALSGKYKGQIFGFPYFASGRCGFKRDSKLKAINAVDVGYYDYESIGIAYDEVKRHGQLNDKKRSILVEKKYTEQLATMYCYHEGLLSPHYEYATRDGCVLCGNGKERERQIWYSDFPEAKLLLIDLQNFVKSEKPSNYPLRNYEWFIDTENQQISFWE